MIFPILGDHQTHYLSLIGGHLTQALEIAEMLFHTAAKGRTGTIQMPSIARYRLHAEALLTISRKFRELSAVDADNAHLLAECAEGLTAIAEALVLEVEDVAARPALPH